MSENLAATRAEADAIQAYFASISSGLVHVHTNASNHRGHRESDLTLGKYRAMIPAAASFVAITDHTSNPSSPERLKLDDPILDRLLETKAAANKSEAILYGVEASIMRRGELDVPDQFLAKCDLVIASHHSLPPTTEKDAAAIAQHFAKMSQNPNVDVLGHPARYISDVDLDWPEVFATAKRTGTAIEVNVNSYPIWPHWWQRAGSQHYLQFWYHWLELAAESGVALTMGSDIHTQAQLYQYGHWVASLDKPRGNYFRQRLARLLRDMQRVGIKPSQVVSRDLATFKAWLATDKPHRQLD